LEWSVNIVFLDAHQGQSGKNYDTGQLQHMKKKSAPHFWLRLLFRHVAVFGRLAGVIPNRATPQRF